MPPNNTPILTEQVKHRKRPSTHRVVPAIPLSLSKPQPARPKPKAESLTRDVGENGTQAGVTKEPPKAQLPVEPAVNGGSEYRVEAEAVEDQHITNDTVAVSESQTPVSRGSGPMSISNGTTPELQDPESDRPSTPPQASETAISISPSSSRKPTDRYDMRQIRPELPPLAPSFVPSAEQHTPRSASSAHSNRPSSHQHAYTTYPGSNGIVFGGQDSSTSSPVPPLSTGSGFAPPFHNNFGTAQQAHGSAHGHSHHTSEPHPQRTYQPFYPQPAMQWAVRQGYGQHAQQAPYYPSPNPMAFRDPPREVFTPTEVRQRNDRSSTSRSASQESSPPPDATKAAQSLQSPMSPEDAPDSAEAMFPQPKAAFPGHVHPRHSHFNAPMPPPPTYPHPDLTADIENAEALRSHIQAHFSEPSLVDCRLLISDESDGSEQSYDGHKLVLSRSPTLINIIRADPAGSIAPPARIPVHLNGKYLRIEAFMEALKYLYGGPLLQLEQHRPGSSPGEDLSSNVARLENALRYIATGLWLKVPAIAARGVEVASGLLHWDTISAALTLALDGGLGPVWTVDDGSEDRASSSSSDDSLTQPEPVGSPTYDPYATHLLQRIVEFTVHMFPPNFYLDASAPQLATCPRLPALPPGHESRQARSDPRLSQIRFGEIPIEDHQRPSFTTTTISSVLLSLPFQILKCVLEHYVLAARLGPDTVSSIMRQVVAERETRRTKALNAHGNGRVDESVDAQLVQNLYWTESVEPSTQHRAGSRLVRRKRDIDTPPSSGACSERNK